MQQRIAETFDSRSVRSGDHAPTKSKSPKSRERPEEEGSPRGLTIGLPLNAILSAVHDDLLILQKCACLSLFLSARE